MRCIECGGAMNPSEESFIERFRGEDITISGIKYFICSECGEIIFDALEGKKYDRCLIDGYAKIAGLLSPTEIKELRGRHGLTQKEFQAVLGVNDPAVSRWESGKVSQMKPVDNLMRVFKEHDNVFLEFIEKAEIRRSDIAMR